MLANVLETRATSGFSYPVQVNNLLSPSPTRPATDIEKRGIKKREQGEEELRVNCNFSSFKRPGFSEPLLKALFSFLIDA